MKKISFIMIGLLTACMVRAQASTDGLKPVSNAEAVAFVNTFYSHMSLKDGTWKDDVLEANLAPSVLKTLTEAASDSEQKYATWLLSGIDESGMLLPSTLSADAVATGDGRVLKEVGVFYWGDSGLRSIQKLYFTVRGNNGQLKITQIDNMNGEAAADVWKQLETRNEGREMESETEIEGDNPLIKSEGKIGPYAVTFYRNPADIGAGDEVGYYYYNDRPNSVFKLILVTNVAINAKGSMHVVLKEYSPQGKHTGTFDGQYECRGGGYVGTFTNSKGKKFHFELMESY